MPTLPDDGWRVNPFDLVLSSYTCASPPMKTHKQGIRYDFHERLPSVLTGRIHFSSTVLTALINRLSD